MSNPVGKVDPWGLWSFYKWLYTGDGNAGDDVYNGAIGAAGGWLYNNSPVRGGYVGGEVGNGSIEVGAGGAWTMDDGGSGYLEGGGYGGGENGWGGVGGGKYGGSSGDGEFGGAAGGQGGASGGMFGGGQWFLGIGKGPFSGGIIIDPRKFRNWWNNL